MCFQFIVAMDDSTEVKFAQRLASNEKKIRDRALKKLKKYINLRAAHPGFTRLELMKLLKGLHYSMWMQDKPLLQEELAGRIADLLLAFPDPSSALQFASCFFATQAREWNRLDQWRMDKFMMLTRNMLRQTFLTVHRAGWDKLLVSEIAHIIGEDIMNPEKEENPDSLRLHFADIYLEEMAGVGAEQLDGEKITKLLEPFYDYIQKSQRMHITSKIMKRIFGSILDQARQERGICRAKTHSSKSCHSAGETSANGEPQARLQYDYKSIAQALFDRGRVADCLPNVRRKIYKMVKKFYDVLDSTEAVDSTYYKETQHSKASKGNKRKKSYRRDDDSVSEVKKLRIDMEGSKPSKIIRKDTSNSQVISEEAVHDQSSPAPVRTHVHHSETPATIKIDSHNLQVAVASKTDFLGPEAALEIKISSDDQKSAVEVTELQQSPAKITKTNTSVLQKSQAKGHKAKKAALETPGSNKKQVVFNLDRNSFRGLQEFVANSSKKESPHVPTKSPKQGILKESPSPASVIAKSNNSSLKSRKSGNKHKRLSSSPLAHFSESSTTTKLKFSPKKHSKKIRKPKVH